MYTDQKDGLQNEPEAIAVTPLVEQVELLKRKYPNQALYLIEVDNGMIQIPFILKAPDRKIMAAVSKVAHTDPFQSTVILVENCLVFGDKNVLEDISIFSAVAEKFETVLQSKKATIKNL